MLVRIAILEFAPSLRKLRYLCSMKVVEFVFVISFFSNFDNCLAKNFLSQNVLIQSKAKNTVNLLNRTKRKLFAKRLSVSVSYKSQHRIWIDRFKFCQWHVCGVEHIGFQTHQTHQLCSLKVKCCSAQCPTSLLNFLTPTIASHFLHLNVYVFVTNLPINMPPTLTPIRRNLQISITSIQQQ